MKPGVIEKLFISREASHGGLFIMRLVVGGKWVPVVVDPLVAMYEGAAGPTPICVRSRTGPVWPVLLEKAYAKISGNYGELDGG